MICAFRRSFVYLHTGETLACVSNRVPIMKLFHRILAVLHYMYSRIQKVSHSSSMRVNDISKYAVELLNLLVTST